MVSCAYCDRPLTCASCRAPYSPRSQAEYEALSRPEVPLACPECESILVCHWCKTPYDGGGEDEDSLAD